jgi:hypothetical protein
MGRSAAKLSVSVPSELAAALRKCVGTRGLSGFVARAIAHELEGIGSLIHELDEKLGLPSQSEMARVRKAWPKR